MCSLFGLIDTQSRLSGKQKSKLLSALSTACEVRGTDATGIAYNTEERLVIYKRPFPAHKMQFRIPREVKVVMGHTRMTTQGSPKKNYNNHPWRGEVGGIPFALAHNGVLYNDRHLRTSLHLPKTNVETDSYVAVQLLEQKNTLHPDSLKFMAETVEGSFVFTVLDGRDNLFFIKGDNPLCIYYYASMGLYLYASTEDILHRVVKRMGLWKGARRIDICEGEILCIDADGHMELSNFNMRHRYIPRYFYGLENWPAPQIHHEYVRELKSVAGAFGYDADDIDMLLCRGCSPEEVEELLYCGEL